QGMTREPALAIPPHPREVLQDLRGREPIFIIRGSGTRVPIARASLKSDFAHRGGARNQDRDVL
ncbi:MAG: hypothetical protein KJS83_06870, partial [Xanthomonadaceae bacterium]|nr:hypothetical protein [Xanthomonadaceae bacterium]